MLDLLKTLCPATGVSGDESDAAKVAELLLSPLGRVAHTPLGSVLCYMPSTKPGLPRVMLAAHLDQVGLIVTRITDKGFLKVAACGGPDRRTLAGARVTVHAASCKLPGVVVATPPHLSDGKTKTAKAEDLAVDVGLSAATAREKVALGDRIVLDGCLEPLFADRVCAAALDDRAGCAAIIRAAQLLKKTQKAEVIVALVSQEEVGSSGAATAAFAVAPDFAFVVDVSMGLTPDEKAESCGEMGKGPMIGVAPILDRRLSRQLTETAKRANIPWQIEVMRGRTGTDADAIAVSGRGVRTALVSIPLRFMHTPSEVVALSDVENTARLIAETVGGDLCNS
ncbi:MAG: M20/M25/M40 family metallo-hydrolase [Candidatus Fimivivens sp.]